MGKIFDDATPEQERDFLERQQKSDFLRACRDRGLWRILAGRHKWAADALYNVAYQSYVRVDAKARAEFAALPSLPPGTVGESHAKILEGDDLLDHMNVHLIGDFYLLGGYAMECALKGILLGMMPELVEDEEQLSKKAGHHRLGDLCGQCAFTISSDEQELLGVMERYIVWGKYPAPLKRENMATWDPDDRRLKRLDIDHPFNDRRAQRLLDGVFDRAMARLMPAA